MLRNDAAAGHWLQLRLVGKQSNRNGVGARVTAFSGNTRQVREVMAGSSFLGGHDPRVHFGLGDRTSVDSLEVEWPSGTIDRLRDLAADRLIVLTEGGEIR